MSNESDWDCATWGEINATKIRAAATRCLNEFLKRIPLSVLEVVSADTACCDKDVNINNFNKFGLKQIFCEHAQFSFVAQCPIQLFNLCTNALKN
jgi:hypothetical protein